MNLNLLPKSKCELELLSLGECMIRFSPPGHQRIELTPYFETWVGGGEYNVAYALARFGLKTAWCGGLVNNPLGMLIRNHARAAGVDLSEAIWMPYDGVGKENRIGFHFTEVGMGVRPSVTIYDRAYTATSHMKPGDVNWKRIFEDRKVQWFHLGGIFTALSDSCAAVAKEAMQAAHDAGTVVSYDLNFRSKLWNSEKAIRVTQDLLPYMSVVIGNEEDFQKVLGVEVENTGADYQSLKVENYQKMVSKVVAEHPHIKIVATTLREVLSGSLNNWSALLYADNQFYQSRKFENLEIEDRVGGGDGFCSGMIYGVLSGMSYEECVNLGAAHGALAQSTRGDTSMVTLEEVLHVMKGGSARIKR